MNSPVFPSLDDIYCTFFKKTFLSLKETKRFPLHVKFWCHLSVSFIVQRIFFLILVLFPSLKIFPQRKMKETKKKRKEKLIRHRKMHRFLWYPFSSTSFQLLFLLLFSLWLLSLYGLLFLLLLFLLLLFLCNR